MRYPRGLVALILVGTLIGAATLVVAEFTTLYVVHAANRSGAVLSAGTGEHNSYAMIPIAVAAVLLAVAVARGGGRYGLAALAVVGLVALLIGLLVDLPDAHRTGLVHSTPTHYVNAASSPRAGMYMETLGAVVLIVTAGIGLLFGQPAAKGQEPASAN